MSVIENGKSSQDQKKYRLLKLDCGLKTLLVSKQDAKIDGPNASSPSKAAAALAVQVGSYKDPEFFHGCAHFLEVSALAAMVTTNIDSHPFLD